MVGGGGGLVLLVALFFGGGSASSSTSSTSSATTTFFSARVFAVVVVVVAGAVFFVAPRRALLDLVVGFGTGTGSGSFSASATLPEVRDRLALVAVGGAVGSSSSSSSSSATTLALLGGGFLVDAAFFAFVFGPAAFFDFEAGAAFGAAFLPLVVLFVGSSSSSSSSSAAGAGAGAGAGAAIISNRESCFPAFFWRRDRRFVAGADFSFSSPLSLPPPVPTPPPNKPSAGDELLSRDDLTGLPPRAFLTGLDRGLEKGLVTGLLVVVSSNTTLTLDFVEAAVLRTRNDGVVVGAGDDVKARLEPPGVVWCWDLVVEVTRGGRLSGVGGGEVG